MRASVLATVFFVLLSACASTGQRTAKAVVPLSEKYSSLSQAVQVLPNVQVSGDYITYGGASSLTGDQEVRFLVDGKVLGTYAQVEPLYPLTEVRRVRLIRPQQAAADFGAQGGNGLIELVLMP